MWQVIGHTKAVNSLKWSLADGRLSHAYLFVGPEHVGKMTLALNLAQALNCASEDKPCGDCHPCRRVLSGNHSDVQIIRTESGQGLSQRKEIGIEQVREVQRTVSLKPYEGNFRVVIIDSAEYMSEGASNCFLKTLEEPPPSTVFVLLSTDENSLLPTILSRCQKIDFRPMPTNEARWALKEQWGISSERAELLARLSRGCLGWAISAVDDNSLLDERSQNMKRLISLSELDISERFRFASELASQFSNDRASVKNQLDLWLTWWRDMLLVKNGCFEFITNVDREGGLNHRAKRYNTNIIRDMIKSIIETMHQLEQNANPRLALEILMLKLPFEREGTHA